VFETDGSTIKTGQKRRRPSGKRIILEQKRKKKQV
jgi:hypothetical protein